MKTLRLNNGANRNEIERTDSIKNFVKTLYDGKPIPKDVENELFREYEKTHDASIKEAIIKGNIRFVYSAAKSFSNDPEEVLDLAMEGCIGLVIAFDKFDPDAGFTFLTFANHYVYKMMAKFIHKSKIVRRSKDSILKYKVSKIREKFFATEGRYPDDSEIINIIREQYDIDIKHSDYIRDITISRLDASYKVGDGDEMTMMESPEFAASENGSYKNDFVYAMDKEDIQNQANEALSILSDRNQQIMKKLFGIGTYREYTPEEIAEEYGMTVARVNQIRKECLLKMKDYKFAV